MCNKNVEGTIPKTVVIGSNGFIGSRFLKFYKGFYQDTIGLDIKSNDSNCLKFDISSMSVKKIGLKDKGYQHALILAGITKISICEREKERSRTINVYGTINLIKELIEEGIKPIFFSSDYVFDGERGGYKDYDPVNPINEYGRQKAEVEAAMSGITKGNYMVLRLGKVFSLTKGDGTLFDEMAGIIKNGGIVRAAYDQIFCPILIDDVIKAVTQLQIKNASGIFNICSLKPFSRYKLALELASAMGNPESCIEPVSIDTIDLSVKRPKNTSMVPERLMKETGLCFDNISECIKKIANNWRQ